MKKKNIVSSNVEPNKEDLWLKDDTLYQYGTKGWQTIHAASGGDYDMSYDKVATYTDSTGQYIRLGRANGRDEDISTILIPKVNSSTAGLMTSDDKNKLDEYPKAEELESSIVQYIDEKTKTPIVLDDEIIESSSNPVKNSALYKEFGKRAYAGVQIAGDITTLTTESTDEEIRKAFAIVNNPYKEDMEKTSPGVTTDPTNAIYICYVLQIVCGMMRAPLSQDGVLIHLVNYASDTWEFMLITPSSKKSLSLNVTRVFLYIGPDSEGNEFKITTNPKIIKLDDVEELIERNNFKTFASWDEYNNYVSEESFVKDIKKTCCNFIYYNTENDNYTSVAFSQTVDGIYCKQIAHIGHLIHERLIKFTDNTRQEIAEIGNWT